MSAERQIAPEATAAMAGRCFGVLQRKCACGGSAGPEGECENCKQKGTSLQRRSAGGGKMPATAPSIVHEVLRSPGRPLDATTRAYMEPRFGHDFGKVQVHVDDRAAESARSVHALAYTVGPHMVFGTGQYLPGASGGRKLIAHELSHVVQQSGLPVQEQAPLPVSGAGETEADRAASEIAAGGRAGSIAPVGHLGVQPDDLDDAFKYVQSRSGDPFQRTAQQGSQDQFYEMLVRSGVSLRKSVEQTHWSSPQERERFIQGYLRYTKARGHEKEYAEAIAAYPPGGSTATPSPAPLIPAPAQRPVTLTAPLRPAMAAALPAPRPGAPHEKSSPDVERMYRRAGLTEAANAIRKCRDGDCSHVLTEAEAYQAYRTGRVTAGLGNPPAGETKSSGQTAVVAVGLAVAPATETIGGAAAKTALERAALRWGAAEVIEGGAAASAAPAGAAAATVAIPIVVGVVIVLATVDLIAYGSFQTALHRLGYVILPNPLGVCIASCHQPSAPDYEPIDPRILHKPLDPIQDADLDTLRRWIEEGRPTEASRKRPVPAPQPVPQPVPVQPAPPPKSRKCTDTEVDGLVRDMHKVCDQVRGCNMQNDTCATATAKVSAYYACISERVNLKKKCFSRAIPVTRVTCSRSRNSTPACASARRS
jgi:hypothetical protein